MSGTYASSDWLSIGGSTDTFGYEINLSIRDRRNRSTMLVDRDARPDVGNSIEVDLGEGQPRFAAHLQLHLAPRIDDQRMAIGLAAVLMPSSLRRSHHKQLG